MLRRNTTAALTLLAALFATEAIAQDILVKQQPSLTDSHMTAKLGTNAAGGVYFAQLGT